MDVTEDMKIKGGTAIKYCGGGGAGRHTGRRRDHLARPFPQRRDHGRPAHSGKRAADPGAFPEERQRFPGLGGHRGGRGRDRRPCVLRLSVALAGFPSGQRHGDRRGGVRRLRVARGDRLARRHRADMVQGVRPLFVACCRDGSCGRRGDCLGRVSGMRLACRSVLCGSRRRLFGGTRLPGLWRARVVGTACRSAHDRQLRLRLLRRARACRASRRAGEDWRERVSGMWVAALCGRSGTRSRIWANRLSEGAVRWLPSGFLRTSTGLAPTSWQNAPPWKRCTCRLPWTWTVRIWAWGTRWP